MIGQSGATSVTRLAVVDAGETALRLIGAAREYSLERGRDLRSSPCTARRSGNLWVREADEAVLIADEDWADAAAIAQVLSAAAIDAIWDGAGSLDARPVLASCCERLGIRRIGATSAALPADRIHGCDPPYGRGCAPRRSPPTVDYDGTMAVVGMCERTSLIESARLHAALD